MLAHPDFTQPFILYTDASATGIGAVLSQRHSDGMKRVISYASRTLSKLERRYCTTRRELLAVVTFVKPYLLGRQFNLRTDHGSLTWLHNFKEPDGQLARWITALHKYDFLVEYRRGKSNGNAHALSRNPGELLVEAAAHPTPHLGVRDQWQDPVVAATSLQGGHIAISRQNQLDDNAIRPVF